MILIYMEGKFIDLSDLVFYLLSNICNFHSFFHKKYYKKVRAWKFIILKLQGLAWPYRFKVSSCSLIRSWTANASMYHCSQCNVDLHDNDCTYIQYFLSRKSLSTWTPFKKLTFYQGKNGTGKKYKHFLKCPVYLHIWSEHVLDFCFHLNAIISLSTLPIFHQAVKLEK